MEAIVPPAPSLSGNRPLVGDHAAARLPYLDRFGQPCQTHGGDMFDDFRIDEAHLAKTPKLHAALRACQIPQDPTWTCMLVGVRPSARDRMGRRWWDLARWATWKDMAAIGYRLPRQAFTQMLLLPICARPGKVSGLLAIGEGWATRILQEPGARRPTGLAGWQCLPLHGQWTVAVDARAWLCEQAESIRLHSCHRPSALMVGGQYDGLWGRFAPEDLARFTPTTSGAEAAIHLGPWPREAPPRRWTPTSRAQVEADFKPLVGEGRDLYDSLATGGAPALRAAMADPAFPINVQADLQANGVSLCDVLNLDLRPREFEFMAGRLRIAHRREGWFRKDSKSPKGWNTRSIMPERLHLRLPLPLAFMVQTCHILATIHAILPIETALRPLP